MNNRQATGGKDTLLEINLVSLNSHREKNVPNNVLGEVRSTDAQRKLLRDVVFSK